MNIRHITVTDVTNIGDPFVLRVGNTYYLYATSFKDGFDYRTSSDLVHWSAPKKAYTAGERSFGYTDFWAPEVIEHEGRYLMHYTARRRSDDTLLIGVAAADRPEGPFRRCHRRTDVRFRLRGDRRTRRPRRDGELSLLFERLFPKRRRGQARKPYLRRSPRRFAHPHFGRARAPS